MLLIPAPFSSGTVNVERTGRPLAVGITGGIGSGKTEVAKIFSSRGASVLYADAIARDLINTSAEIKKRIRKDFGEAAFDAQGNLNRKHIAKLVFCDPALKEALDRIVHPFVLGEIEKEIARFKDRHDGEIIAVEAALLYEAGAEGLFDYMIVVDADEELRIARLMKRDGSNRQEILQRMKAQMPAKEKAERSDFVIANKGGLKALEENCRFVYSIILALAQSGANRGTDKDAV